MGTPACWAGSSRPSRPRSAGRSWSRAAVCVRARRPRSPVRRAPRRERRLLDLAEDPARRVGGQLGEVLQELLDVLTGDAGPEVVAEEPVEVRRDALGEEAAAAEGREDEALHGPEPAAAWQLARDLLALGVERRDHRRRVGARLLPDAEKRHEEPLRVPVD